MQVSVAYAESGHQVWLSLEVPEGSTVQQAIELSGVLGRYPHLNLKKNKIGILASSPSRPHRWRRGIGSKSTDRSPSIPRPCRNGKSRWMTMTMTMTTIDCGPIFLVP